MSGMDFGNADLCKLTGKNIPSQIYIQAMSLEVCNSWYMDFQQVLQGSGKWLCDYPDDILHYFHTEMKPNMD